MDQCLLPPRDTIARKIVLLYLFLYPFLYACIGVFLGQDVNWDFRNYHWYNGWAFVSGRYADQTDFIPSQIQYFFNPLLDGFFYLLAHFSSPKFAQFIWGFIQGLNFVILFFLSRSVFYPLKEPKISYISLLIAALGMTGILSVSLSGMTINDNIVSIGILFSLLLIVNQQDEKSSRNIFLSGIPAGIATGLKLTCAPFCIGILISYFILESRKNLRQSVLRSVFLSCGMLAGFLISYGYWGWFLYSHYENPFFPFFNSLFQSPFWINADLEVIQDQNITDIISFPFFSAAKLTMEGILWKDFRIALFFYMIISIFVLNLIRRNEVGVSYIKKPIALFLAIGSLISYLI